MLTPMQAAHVAAVFPECKSQMADYLAAGVNVVVGPQNECASCDVQLLLQSPQIRLSGSITETVEAAKDRAHRLGLRVVER